MTKLSADVTLEQGAARSRRQVPPALFAAVAVLIISVLVALIVPSFLVDPATQSLAQTLSPPGKGGHLLGTDQLGRDELVRVLVGFRVTLAGAGVGTLLAALVGVSIGMTSGYFGGNVDNFLMRLVDAVLAVPGLLIMLVFAMVLPRSYITTVALLAAIGWVVFARVSRSQVLSMRESDMVVSLKASGIGDKRIILRHVLPNSLGPLLTTAVFMLATLVMLQTSLGYLGLGIPPPTPELGNMISEGQELLTAGAWWMIVFPSAALVFLVAVSTIIGEGLRKLMDVKEGT